MKNKPKVPKPDLYHPCPAVFIGSEADADTYQGGYNRFQGGRRHLLRGVQ